MLGLSERRNWSLLHVTEFWYVGEATNLEKDLVAEYELQLLSVCMFYLEYCDAIRQGDGERLSHKVLEVLIANFLQLQANKL